MSFSNGTAALQPTNSPTPLGNDNFRDGDVMQRAIQQLLSTTVAAAEKATSNNPDDGVRTNATGEVGLTGSSESGNPRIDVSAYKEALDKCPDLIQTESNPAWFLKREGGDAESASRRLMEYWTCRKSIFANRAFLPLKLGSAIRNIDWSTIQSGYMAFLPDDKNGRKVLCIDPSRIPEGVSAKCQERSIFYVISEVNNNPHAQTDGIAILFRAVPGVKTPSDRKLMSELLQDVLPIQVSSLHLAYEGPEEKRFLQSVPDIQAGFGGWSVVSNVVAHTGSNPSLLGRKLQSHFRDFPSTMGGAWNYDSWKESLKKGPMREVSSLLSDEEQYKKMEDALNKLVEEAKTDKTIPNTQPYEEALKRAPELIKTEANPLMFLRHAQGKAMTAARCMLSYWVHRKHVFGGEKAFLPLKLGGALSQKDYDSMKNGGFSLLRNDRFGRSVVCIDFGRRHKTQGEKQCPPDEYIRGIFYVLSLASQNPTSQTDGVVVVAALSFSASTQLNCMNEVRKILSDALPIKIQSLHYVCRNPSGSSRLVVDNFIPTIGVDRMLGTKNVVITVKKSRVALFKRLKAYGLQKAGIPKLIGGTFTYEDWEKYLEETPASLSIPPFCLMQGGTKGEMESRSTEDELLSLGAEDDLEDTEEDSKPAAVEKSPQGAQEFKQEVVKPNVMQQLNVAQQPDPLVFPVAQATLTIPETVEPVKQAPAAAQMAQFPKQAAKRPAAKQEAPAAKKVKPTPSVTQNLFNEALNEIAEGMSESDKAHLKDSQSHAYKALMQEGVKLLSAGIAINEKSLGHCSDDTIKKLDAVMSSKPGECFQRGDTYEERAEFIRKRNAIYSKRKYYKKKLKMESLNGSKDRLFEENQALKAENLRLKSLVSEAQRLVQMEDIREGKGMGSSSLMHQNVTNQPGGMRSVSLESAGALGLGGQSTSSVPKRRDTDFLGALRGAQRSNNPAYNSLDRTMGIQQFMPNNPSRYSDSSILEARLAGSQSGFNHSQYLSNMGGGNSILDRRFDSAYAAAAEARQLKELEVARLQQELALRQGLAPQNIENRQQRMMPPRQDDMYNMRESMPGSRQSFNAGSNPSELLALLEERRAQEQLLSRGMSQRSNDDAALLRLMELQRRRGMF